MRFEENRNVFFCCFQFVNFFLLLSDYIINRWISKSDSKRSRLLFELLDEAKTERIKMAQSPITNNIRCVLFLKFLSLIAYHGKNAETQINK